MPERDPTGKHDSLGERCVYSGHRGVGTGIAATLRLRPCVSTAAVLADV